MKKDVVQFANDVLGINLYPAQAEALLAMAGYQLVALAPVAGEAASPC